MDNPSPKVIGPREYYLASTQIKCCLWIFFFKLNVLRLNYNFTIAPFDFVNLQRK